MVIVVSFVLKNTFDLIFLNVDGNDILVNVLQSLKQLFPIDVIPSGMVIVVSFVSENAFHPILINVDGNDILVNVVHSLKHIFPIDVIPSGIIHFPFLMDILLFSNQFLYYLIQLS